MTQSVNRRGFLGTTVTAGAAAVASGAFVGARADDSKDKQPVTVGVMGLSRGLSLAGTFSSLDGVSVKYVCDVDETRASSAANQIKGSQPVTDYRRVLDDDSIDALVCAAPNHWHAPATILACNAGKHVYVEKPCSHNPWEGELMVQAARKADRAVQMGTQRRSSASFIEAIQQLQEGVIGRVYLARAWYNNLRGPIGEGKPADPPANLDYDLWQGPAPRKPYVDNRSHYNWHWFWHWGNGELGNNGVHSLDICRWGLDVTAPTRVTSSGGRYRYDDDQETPDTHTVAFEFPGEKQITWQGLSCNRHSVDSGFVAFFGEEGSMSIAGSGSYRIYDRRHQLVKEGTAKLSDSDHIQNFIDAIRTGQHQNLNAEIEKGHYSTLLCHLGNIAHRTGRALECNPENGHIKNDEDAMQHWKREYEPGWEPKIG